MKRGAALQGKGVGAWIVCREAGQGRGGADQCAPGSVRMGTRLYALPGGRARAWGRGSVRPRQREDGNGTHIALSKACRQFIH